MPETHPDAPALTGRLAAAFRLAHEAHRGQTRKGTAIPYISHPMAVAAIVLEHGGDEDQAAAALLHDTLEDSTVSGERLYLEFGPLVARIVEDCTDARGPDKPPWRPRKERHLEHLRRCGAEALLVSAADKLHNARAIVRDVGREGPGVWGRFNAPSPGDVVWYYGSMLQVFEGRRPELPAGFGRLVEELAGAISELKRLAAEAPQPGGRQGR